MPDVENRLVGGEGGTHGDRGVDIHTLPRVE